MKKNDISHVRLQKQLLQRKSKHKFRTLKTIDDTQSSRLLRMDGVEYLNFSSNDYLNLSNHPHLKEKSREYTRLYGTGSSSSRLITGSLGIHRSLEQRLAELYQKEAALLFSTGFQANSTILPAITQKNDVILADEYCHNSILTGCLASKAKFYRFNHNDVQHLEMFLKRKSEENIQNIWIVTESLFSMSGDRAPLEKMIHLASAYNAKLYVDDAHALGVKGKNGLGYGAGNDQIDLLVSTFGKAGGSFGAFAASKKIVIETLVNYCTGFIYTTALPPAVTGAIDAALDLIPQMDSERKYLHELSDYLYSNVKKMNLKTSGDPSHILPVILGDEKIVLEQSRLLEENGIISTAIRPPAVPKDESRFRISLTSAHQKSDCDKLLSVLENES